MPWPAVGIGENQNLEFFRQLLNCGPEIVNLLPTILRRPGEDDMAPPASLRRHTFHDAHGRIGFRCQNKKHSIILVIEFAQRGQISFESRFHSLTRTQYCGTRRVEAGIGSGAPPHVRKPFRGLVHQVQTHQNLQCAQKNKQIFHVCRE